MSRHRLDAAKRVRPRIGRMTAAGVSLVVTMVALLGGVGVLPLQSADTGIDATVASSGTKATTADDSAAIDTAEGAGAPDVAVEPPEASRSSTDRSMADALEQVAEPVPDNGHSKALPAGSGSGRRAVFSKSAQRVWLVDNRDAVVSTYLVSGSVTNNLRPGSY